MGTGVQRFRLFIWVATALWLIAALAAIIDGDMLNAIAWFGFVAAGAVSRNAPGDWLTLPWRCWSLPWGS
jgi:uncharacterized MnhB-related membrane protein